MTSRKLNQLYYLNREIAVYEKILAQYGDERDGSDISREIAILKTRADDEKKKIIEYISTVNDSYMRTILILRSLQCKSWTRIGIEMHTNADAVKKAYYRYLNKGL